LVRVLGLPRNGEKAYGEGCERKLAAQAVSEKRFHRESPFCVSQAMHFFPAFIAFNQQDRVAQVNIPDGRANLLLGIKSQERESHG
jgi:hypothetical protein